VKPLRILMWHVHGSYLTALLEGPHTYLLPVLPDRPPDGRGRARTWNWPANAIELTPEELRDSEVNLVVAQRPHELELAERWLGRQPGRDVAALYLEHTSPEGEVTCMRHPVADRDGLLLVHVTHFNALFWDGGSTETRVVEHGIVDPGYRYSGELPRAAVVVNEARRRGRVTGTDLLPHLNGDIRIDLFGMDAAALGGIEDLPQARLHDEIARRRVYLHPIRWTSLGLSLLEAMHLGMPVVALATTEVVEAVPREAGVVSNRVPILRDALRTFIHDPDEARARGRAARKSVLQRYGLARFLADWDRVFAEAVAG
jgi:glycosyltransferase involved in cell wall biosynthesis